MASLERVPLGLNSRLIPIFVPAWGKSLHVRDPRLNRGLVPHQRITGFVWVYDSNGFGSGASQDGFREWNPTGWTASVSAVPEPNSMLMFGMVRMALMVHRRRRV